MQAPIVDKANTAERLSKDDPLLLSRIEPILVCPLGLLAHGLCVFLICYVASDCLHRDASHSANEGAVCPQGRDFALEFWERFLQVVRNRSFDGSHQLVDSELRITANHQMDMVRHGPHFNPCLLPFLNTNTFLDEYLQSGIAGRKQDLTSVLRAEYQMVGGNGRPHECCRELLSSCSDYHTKQETSRVPSIGTRPLCPSPIQRSALYRHV